MSSGRTGPPDAASILRGVGLRADGPVTWGTVPRAQGPGVFVVETAVPSNQAPLDMSRIGIWLERVQTLLVDGRRPTTHELAARLAGYWLPGQPVLYVGWSHSTLGRRAAGLYRTPLGDRRPNSGAQWLMTLRGFDRFRLWWAETDADEEYADAILGAFAAAVPAEVSERLHDPTIVLPFANRESVLGERKAHGISGAVLAAPDEPAAPPLKPARIVPQVRAERAVGAPRPRAIPGDGRRVPRSKSPPGPSRAAPVPTYLSAAGLAAVEAELEDLRAIRRPQVIARVQAARELGDLRENAEYDAARKEQSFLEGRIQLLEGRLRAAVIIEEPVKAEVVHLGSTVVVEVDGLDETFVIVGPHEADPRSGRISHRSPIGQALVGRRPGDEAVVQVPGGSVSYRIRQVL